MWDWLKINYGAHAHHNEVTCHMSQQCGSLMFFNSLDNVDNKRALWHRVINDIRLKQHRQYLVVLVHYWILVLMFWQWQKMGNITSLKDDIDGKCVLQHNVCSFILFIYLPTSVLLLNKAFKTVYFYVQHITSLCTSSTTGPITTKNALTQ